VEVEAVGNRKKYCAACVYERRREHDREHHQKPEIRERRREYERERYKKPEVKKRAREYDRERKRAKTLTTIKRIAAAMQTKDPEKGNA
jgi:hypothetical protein